MPESSQRNVAGSSEIRPDPLGGGIFPESSQTERVDSTLHLNLNIKMPEDSLEGGGGGGGGF